MRFALFSDIHGNLTGLRAVLSAIPALGGADVLIAAGDLISGESGTDEILELLDAHQVVAVQGDSDTEEKLLRLEQEALAAPGTTRNSLAYYRDMRLWLRENLSESGRASLAALPISRTFEVEGGQRLYVCHASPRSTGERVCAPFCPPETVREAFQSVQADVIAFGHAHHSHTRLLEGRLYINVASVGIRQDGLSWLTLLTAEAGQWVVEQHAIPYDVATEARRCVERKVPPLSP